MTALLVLAITAALIALVSRRQLKAERKARGFWQAEKAEAERLLAKASTLAEETPRKAQAERIVNALLAQGFVKVPADLDAAYKCAESTLRQQQKETSAAKADEPKREMIISIGGRRT